jgi:hypothetical protein
MERNRAALPRTEHRNVAGTLFYETEDKRPVRLVSDADGDGEGKARHFALTFRHM